MMFQMTNARTVRFFLCYGDQLTMATLLVLPNWKASMNSLAAALVRRLNITSITFKPTSLGKWGLVVLK